MPKFIGRKINVWFGKETVRGTAVSVTKFVPKTNMDFDEKYENVVDESSIWVIVDSAEAHNTKRWAEGNIETNVNVNSLWLPLLSLMWTVASATATTGAFTHTFNLLNTNQHPSLTIGVSDGVQDFSFPLAMIDSMTIGANVWEIATTSMTYKSKKGATATHTVTYSQDYPLLAKNWVFKVANNLAWLAAASPLCIQSFEITITKNLEDIYCMWSVDPTDFVNKQFVIEWSFTSIFEDTATYKDIALAGTEKAIRFTLTDTDTIIGLSSNPTLNIDLPKANFTEWSRTMGNDEVVSQTVNFKGLYSIADSKAIEIKLTNTDTSY